MKPDYVNAKRLGDLLRERGYVTDAQIEEALRVQSRPGEKRLLGQILVGREYATAAEVQVALAKQKLPSKQPPRGEAKLRG